MAKQLKQLTFKKTSGWGGKRKNSGRKNKSGTVNHMARPQINLKMPLHITLRLIDKLPNIRRKFLHEEFKECLRKAKEQGLYVIHYSIQSNHIHVIAEAKNNSALALGMRALAGRFAKIFRQYAHSATRVSNQGSVFKGRYHLHVLKTPTEVKNALEYVLLNLSKHQKFIEYVDHFSSAQYFRDWKSLLGNRFKSVIKFTADNFEKQIDGPLGNKEAKMGGTEFLSQPTSWLARSGWLRA